MKISVVMATYNGVDYLYEQLDSLRDQTRKIDEVIICDDQSKDNTVELIRNYIKENDLAETWSVQVNEKNLGYADNFHKALTLATGDYIFFADQDDIWMLNKIEEMVKVMEANPKIQLLCSDYEPFTSAENAPSVPKKIMDKMTGDGSVEQIPLNAANIHIASLGCDMCIRKSFRDTIEPFWISGWAHDDYVWKTAQVLDGCFTYHKPMIKRRLHANNVSMKKMHVNDIRIKFLKNLLVSYQQTQKLVEHVDASKSAKTLLKRCIKSTELRIGLLENKKLWNAVPLALGYAKYYHSRKSIPVELLMAIKSKK